MIQEIHTIVSPFKGTIEKVFIKENSYIYEWEKLFLIKSFEGDIMEISIGASGIITSLCVKEGDHVSTENILAHLKDDLLITGSD
ncbi:hypothetical protein [Alkalihalobacillus sp. BA299]|uniref:hypothetical protein n=1 Tax=Alkalihalobacillus sp. BA299 TaxID=2815938 RepID=UPI001FFE20E4|nr:hypothetical protein [Alkalihalobacillus sp. BA299]